MSCKRDGSGLFRILRKGRSRHMSEPRPTANHLNPVGGRLFLVLSDLSIAAWNMCSCLGKRSGADVRGTARGQWIHMRREKSRTNNSRNNAMFQLHGKTRGTFTYVPWTQTHDVGGPTGRGASIPSPSLAPSTSSSSVRLNMRAL